MLAYTLLVYKRPRINNVRRFILTERDLKKKTLISIINAYSLGLRHHSVSDVFWSV